MKHNFQHKMKTFTCSVNKIVLGLGLASLCTVLQAQEVYTNGFEGIETGLANDSVIKGDWSSRYAKGPDEGRVTITNSGVSGKAARILYPAGGNQSSRSGATWETDIQVSADELYMAYWVKFDADFQFVKGGKLPGLAGSTSFPYGDNDFTTRLMWREEGKLEFYLHGFKLNNEEGSEPYRVFWDDFGEHARVIPGQWHHIEIRQRLNTPGMRNGRLQGWLDGVLMIDDSSNSGVRDGGQSSTKINQLYFSTFFGGSSAPASQWQPTQDVYATFDDFIVSTQRIGMGGSIPDPSPDPDPIPDPIPDPDPIDETPDEGANGTCVPVDVVNSKIEINLGSANCIEFSRDLSERRLAVWDSDLANACDFRGSLSAANGSGALVVPDNYEATQSVSGRLFNVVNASGNSCRLMKIRAW
ncbi:hypothetical protein ISG33_10060 [Glaciecola sp. MH2013]|uniref:polysaccharide lyase n=1 Tax=Glaciecola sp. MH2013 TaxID=2785524 RepID=UPI0018A0BE2C|nr:hypothetical protein [Glaciecola sp. MH2013]MBF7073740.1 hypothetical protein [Glaciecola sp. MH2013]